MQSFAIHGGRLSEAQAAFPEACTPWIDLSTGVNPWPYPARFATPAARSRLPEPGEIAALEADAAAAFDLDPASVLATAGADAGARLLAEALGAKKVGIAEPTYSGQKAAWWAAGAEVVSLRRGELETFEIALDAAVLVNPNNPDGLATKADRLAGVAQRFEERNMWLILDESFVDADPGLSIAHVAGPGWSLPRTLALRSFGKFWGLPGVRLGFITGHPQVISRLRQRLGAWPISADAIAAGREGYQDWSWAGGMRRRLQAAAARLDQTLTLAGFEIVGGTCLFRLAARDDAASRFMDLARAGILTRPFSYAPEWLRFGLPKDHQWLRLQAALGISDHEQG